jgi:hypothetical protein
MKCPKFRLPYMANIAAMTTPAGQMTDPLGTKSEAAC